MALSAGTRRTAVLSAVLLASVLVYALIVGRFFPNRQGAIGQDYSFFLPYLLDGWFWYLQNGLAAVPWFTAAFCGGQPLYADPQALYFSVPQLLVLAMDPLRAVHLTVVVFAVAGLLGFYRLMRDPFGVSEFPAALGAALFMFNNFYLAHMIVGHLAFHAIMLVPWVAWAVMSRPGSRRADEILPALAGGLCVAYWIHAGMAVMLLPAALSVLAVFFTLGVIRARPEVATGRVFAIVVLGLALGAGKLAAALAFVSNVDRAAYALPGFDRWSSAAGMVPLLLFWNVENVLRTASEHVVGGRVRLDRHEFEFGVSLLPAELLVIGAACWAIRAAARKRIDAGMARSQAIYLFALALLWAAVVASNIFSPTVQAVLKALPIVKQQSTMLRWVWILIPPVILWSVLALEHAPYLSRWKAVIALGGIAALLAFNLVNNRDYYDREAYSPDDIVEAYRRVAAGEPPPPVSQVVFSAQSGQTLKSVLSRNGAFTRGASQLACYNAMFGYFLEGFRVGVLHPGGIMDQIDGQLNLKNPACYVFPRENGCAPGDHFLASQQTEARALAERRPFRFRRSWTQELADAVSLAGVLASIMALLVWAASKARNRGTTA